MTNSRKFLTRIKMSLYGIYYVNYRVLLFISTLYFVDQEIALLRSTFDELYYGS